MRRSRVASRVSTISPSLYLLETTRPLNLRYPVADLLRVSVGIEDFQDIKRDFEQAFKAANLKPADKTGTDPFAKASDLVSGGFMGKLSTGAPKPGTDGTIEA
jgi:hypothetical protein